MVQVIKGVWDGSEGLVLRSGGGGAHASQCGAGPSAEGRGGDVSLAENAAALGGKLWSAHGHAHYYFPQHALNWFAGISYQAYGDPCCRGRRITPIQARRLRTALWKVAVSAEPEQWGRVLIASDSCRGAHRAKLIRSPLATAAQMREIAQGQAALLLSGDAGIPAEIAEWPCDVKSAF
jgi:hypothetical protein